MAFNTWIAEILTHCYHAVEEGPCQPGYCLSVSHPTIDSILYIAHVSEVQLTRVISKC